MDNWWRKFISSGKIEFYLKHKELQERANGGEDAEQSRRDSDQEY